ncbi:hNH endonuclease [Escherichia coli]|nr:hNH endonuclease [Escherichia coli]EJW8627628.1 hNH endonuclease [Escherichia coli]
MKQMSLIEMDGFLKGKCIPSDLKVNETNAEYLVRKFAEAEAKISALSEDHQKAIESIKQADAAVKLAHEKFSALAAENAGLKSGAIKAIEDIQCFYDSEAWHVSEDGESETAVVALDDAKGSVEHFVLNVKTPATDAFLSEIERKAIRKFINSIEHILRDKLSPYDTEEMLEAMRIFLEEQSGEQK